jgi:MarR family transcriptional regulator, transcriptional regulator for hemolysin
MFADRPPCPGRPRFDIKSLDVKVHDTITGNVGRPEHAPLGLELARTARVVTAAFERAMAQAGGSAATWQVLVLVRAERWGTQAAMAEAMGITPATLTHHLNALEEQGLVRRWREASNRRVQLVELTDEGRAAFDRLRGVAQRHDQRLRATLGEEGSAQLVELLGRLLAGVDERASTAAAAGAASARRRAVAGGG